MSLLSLPYALTQAPVVGAVLVSRQGPRRHGFHNGVDLSVVSGGQAARGASVRSIMPGVVEQVCRYPERCCGGYGTSVLVRHADDLFSFYAHLDRADVEEGQEVGWTTVLGAVGNQFADFRVRGCPRVSIVPHLHLEIRHADGSRYDVLQVLAAGGLGVDRTAALVRTEPFEYAEPRLYGAKAEGAPEVIVGSSALRYGRWYAIGLPIAVTAFGLAVVVGLGK